MLNPGWDDVVDEPVPYWFCSAGVDQPAIHQIEKLSEDHEVDLGLAQVQVRQTDVGQPRERGGRVGVYASFAWPFGAGTVSIALRVPCCKAAAIADR